MKKELSLKNTASFSYIRKRGGRAETSHVMLRYVTAGSLKLGVSVTKKVGGAVERNLLKRRVKEIFVVNAPKLKKVNLVVSLKVGSIDADFAVLKEELESLFAKCGLYTQC